MARQEWGTTSLVRFLALTSCVDQLLAATIGQAAEDDIIGAWNSIRHAVNVFEQAGDLLRALEREIEVAGSFRAPD